MKYFVYFLFACILAIGVGAWSASWTDNTSQSEQRQPVKAPRYDPWKMPEEKA